MDRNQTIKKLLAPDKYGKRKTLQEVADVFGISREYVRQINGNVGDWKVQAKKQLQDNKELYGKRLYRDEDITIAEVCKLFGLCKSYVLSVVGKRMDYDREHGERLCSDCGTVKSIDNFYPVGISRARTCNACSNKRTVEYIKTHRDQFNATCRRRYANNPKIREYQREYARSHSKERNAYSRRRYHEDAEYRAKMLAYEKRRREMKKGL